MLIQQVLSLRFVDFMEASNIWITEANYIDGYLIKLSFNNGETKLFNGTDLISSNAVFAPLKDLSNFKDFTLDGWTLTWNNGKLDISPEYLYENSTLTCIAAEPTPHYKTK